MTAPAATQPVDFYGTFCGPIDEGSAFRLCHWLDLASQKQSPSVHLLFQSSGGNVGDGVFLYNYFRSLPFKLTIYNAGSVSSVATVAFLGARHRLVSHAATFMLHQTMFTGLPATAQQLQARVTSLALDDQRTLSILRQHLTLEPARWDDLNGNEVWFSADEAVRIGMADGIADFSPPAGTPITDFNFIQS
ncbi:MAG: ATP-dependent Clp protease proteolytic subunit [Gemmatimonadota bacterium]